MDELTKADPAQAELAIVAMSPTAALAAVVASYREFWFLLLFV